MVRATDEQFRDELEELAGQRFGGEVHGVMGPRRGVIRVLVRTSGPDGRERPLRDFELAHRPDMVRFRDDVAERFPAARKLEFVLDDGRGDRWTRPVNVIIAPLDKALPGEGDGTGGGPAGTLTPVMARLGAAELEIVDTLISAGIAANRAEAIRWALTRISERPAYAQLRERTREIERLRTEF
jgi:hypothetical protein